MKLSNYQDSSKYWFGGQYATSTICFNVSCLILLSIYCGARHVSLINIVHFILYVLYHFILIIQYLLIYLVNNCIVDLHTLPMMLEMSVAFRRLYPHMTNSTVICIK